MIFSLSDSEDKHQQQQDLCQYVVGSKTRSKQRPALQNLNDLNRQLEASEKQIRLQIRVDQLERENQQLFNQIDSLRQQLQLQRKLRKSWEKQNNSAQLLQDIPSIRARLQKIKNKD